MEVLVIVLFGFLLLCTLLKAIKYFEFLVIQFPRLFQFIPSWNFFAPVPIMFDFELQYRYVFEDGTIGRWIQAYAPHDRSAFSMLWNPGRKELKTFVDLTIDLLKLCTSTDKSKICTSIPYLSLLNYVNYQEKHVSASRVQFMILRYSKLYEPEIVFRSETHPLVMT